jgi:hypothetical protein
MSKNEIDSLEKKYEEMLNKRCEVLQKQYEITLYKELNLIALNFDSIRIISTMLMHMEFNRLPTCNVYEIYKILCTNNGISYMANVEFSRFIVKWFGYTIIDKKFHGVKYRIFIKLPGAVQDEVESSSSVQDDGSR